MQALLRRARRARRCSVRCNSHFYKRMSFTVQPTKHTAPSRRVWPDASRGCRSSLCVVAPPDSR